LAAGAAAYYHRTHRSRDKAPIHRTHTNYRFGWAGPVPQPQRGDQCSSDPVEIVSSHDHPPIDTSAEPLSTAPPQSIASPTRPAGFPLINTLLDPTASARPCGGCFGLECDAKASPSRSAGLPFMPTLSLPSMAGVCGNPSCSEPVSPNRPAAGITPPPIHRIQCPVLCSSNKQ